MCTVQPFVDDLIELLIEERRAEYGNNAPIVVRRELAQAQADRLRTTPAERIDRLRNLATAAKRD